MNILNKILFFLLVILGTLTLLLKKNHLNNIKYSDMKNLNNISRIEIENDNAYLYTYNQTDKDILHINII